MERETKRAQAARVLAALGKALCYLLLFLGRQALVSVVYTTAAALYVSFSQGISDPAALSREMMELVFAHTGQISLISNLAVLAVLFPFFLLRRKKPLDEMRAHPAPLSSAVAAAGLAPVLYLLVICAMSLLPQAWLESYAEASTSLSQTGPLITLATVAAAPIAEEIVFRGLILSRLARAMPRWLAVVLSAPLFGLCHGQPVWIAYAFTLGLVFGLMAHRSGSILPPMLAHMVFNGIGQLAAAFEQAGRSPSTVLILLALAGAVVCVLDRRGLAGLFCKTPIEKEEP